MPRVGQRVRRRPARLGGALQAEHRQGPNAWLYVVIQPPVWAALTEKIGRPELAEDPDYATPEARLPRLDEMFDLIEEWTLTQDQVGGVRRAQRASTSRAGRC